MKCTGMIEHLVRTFDILDQMLAMAEMPSTVTKYQLAITNRRIIGDLTKAKERFYTILDADDCVHPILNNRLDDILVESQIAIPEIIWEISYGSNSRRPRAFKKRNRCSKN